MFNSKYFIGVVEDRHDPEMIGRCKVRVFGIHTESKNLLPTEDLPWAIPIQPITSSGISGIGTSPLGPLEGTWVLLIFLDGDDCQQPAMLGVVSSKIGENIFGDVDRRKSIENVNDGILRDSSGNIIRDSSNSPIRAGVPRVEGWNLGQTSERYESGGKGSGTINNYNNSNDPGGASYGTYQFASYLPSTMGNGRSRISPKNSPVLTFIRNSSFRNEFDGLVPATQQFDSKWIQIAQNNKEAFEKEQHDYIQSKYYNVCLANLQRRGLDLSIYGPAVQDLIWSSAVQLGANNVSVFTTPLRNKSDLSDRDIVELVMEYKISNVENLFPSSSSEIQESVRSRYLSEKDQLLNLITT